MPDATPALLPVTVVTGFLGSGKTTLINRLLRHPDMGGCAVLVNEFGEIGLDHILVEAIDETTVLVGAGCLCCTVREDVVVALDGLLTRRDAGEVPWFDRALIETTGLADPAPLLHTLLADDRLRERCRIDSIVTTVDARQGESQLDGHGESVRQVAAADRLLVTKTDLTAPDAVAALARRLAAMSGAPATDAAEASPADLFAGDLDEARIARWLALPAGHHHDLGVTSISLTARSPLRIDRVVAWIEDILARHGDRLLRLKGLLDPEGCDVPVVVHGVGHVFHPLQRLAAWPEGPRLSRVVLIGRDLPRAEIDTGFASACRAH